MSTHLLRTTVGGFSRFSGRYKPNGASSATDIAFYTCEYDRIVYSMWRRDVSTDEFHISKFNIQTGVSSYIGYVTTTQVGYTDEVGGWLCDGKYMYFTISNGNGRVVRISLSDYTRTVYTNDVPYTCWGRSKWYDDHTIAVMDQRGITFFDTKALTFSHMRYRSTATGGINQFHITDKMVGEASRNDGSYFAWYNRITDEYHTSNLPTSSYPCELCYGDGKFYIINKAYIFIFDEETETWEDEYIPVQFTTAGGSYPAEIRYCVYSEGVVYIIVEGSPRLWAFDTESKKVSYKMLPWSIPGYTNGGSNLRGRQCIITPYHRYVFIQCYSFAYISYEGIYKYNMGYKYLQYSIPCAKDLIEYESKDPCLVLEDSYLTYDDSKPDIIPFVPMYQYPSIKTASVNKNNYKTILSIKIK